MRGSRSRNKGGFTLIETLVALAVVAIGMAALWKGLSQGQAVSQALPDRIQARWVAQNHLLTRQLMEEWPDTRTYTGTEVMGGREWYWQEQVSNTDVPEIRRITIQVGHAADAFVIVVEGYLHRTRPPLPYERIF
jgi:general secretion pathway protein I